MGATYRAVMMTRKGGPEVLETVELPLRAPEAGEVRVRVRACGVGSTDTLMRTGYYPYAPKLPFVQGYDVVGDVDAVGDGVTTVAVGDRVCCLSVWGGYAEMFYRGADELVVVPPGLDDAEVVALILNYVTAYQMLHRTAKQQKGETCLATGANGGVGLALLELCALHGVTAYGAAASKSFDVVKTYGAVPIESRGEKPIDELMPVKVDASYDALGGQYVSQCTRATRKGGIVVGYGFTATNVNGRQSNLKVLRTYGALFLGAKLRGRRSTFYGITALYRKDKQPFREDMAVLMGLLGDRKLAPRIAERFPLLDARAANERLEKGGVDGKLVLVAS